jgi:translation initiation factor 2 subunit 3
LVGLPDSLPPDIYDVTIDLHLFETAVGTQEPVKVDPIKIKESLRLNIGTAATLGSVTHVKDHTVEIKLKKPVCMVSNNRVAISRRISDRWRLIGSGIAS